MAENRVITYAEALREAMREELRRDDKVFLMGEDIGAYGGCFGVTKGLLEEFGPVRVRETPISETAFVGAGIGAAMMGYRPVVEIMFSDFAAVCFDQIVNQAAKIHYMSGGKVNVPLVIRTPQGGGTGAAAQHSQTLEALYCHIPGLKVAVPSDAYDAKGLLKTAIRDNDPVMFLETKLLYKTTGEVPKEEYLIPFGRAAIKREGTDCTLVCWGGTVPLCLEAANILAAEGISAEIIDLRTLVPLDMETVMESVKKTRRLCIAHEAVKTGGFGAEISARICESELFSCLTAPVKRIGAMECPMPCSKVLEAAVLPNAEKIAVAVRETVKKPSCV